jgi:cob(I)alamin adenosyltransferase
LRPLCPPAHRSCCPRGEAAARLHLARTVCRRAEREVVHLASLSPVEPILIRWLNRLSDLLFVQARAANQAAGVADVPWLGRNAPRA